MPIKVKFCRTDEAEVKGSTVYFVVSIGRGLAVKPLGSEAEHLAACTKKINMLKDEVKPTRAVLVDTGALQRHNFDLFTIPPKEHNDPKRKIFPVDKVNKMPVLSDAELVAAFRALESDVQLMKQINDKKVDEEVAADVLAAMFKPFAEKAGKVYSEQLKSTWHTLKVSEDAKGPGLKSVEMFDWQQTLDEYKNDYAKELKKLEEEYNDEHGSVRRGIDQAIRDKLVKKPVVLAGERLKEIAAKIESFKGADPRLLKFLNALPGLNFELIGQMSSRNYFIEEIAHMACLAGRGLYFYPGKSPRGLEQISKDKKIPWKEIRFEEAEANNTKRNSTLPGLTKKREGSESSVNTDSETSPETGAEKPSIGNTLSPVKPAIDNSVRSNVVCEEKSKVDVEIIKLPPVTVLPEKELAIKSEIENLVVSNVVFEEKAAVDSVIVKSPSVTMLPQKTDERTLDAIFDQEVGSSSDDSGQEDNSRVLVRRNSQIRPKSTTGEVTNMLNRVLSSPHLKGLDKSSNRAMSPECKQHDRSFETLPQRSDSQVNIVTPEKVSAGRARAGLFEMSVLLQQMMFNPQTQNQQPGITLTEEEIDAEAAWTKIASLMKHINSDTNYISSNLIRDRLKKEMVIFLGALEKIDEKQRASSKPSAGFSPGK